MEILSFQIEELEPLKEVLFYDSFNTFTCQNVLCQSMWNSPNIYSLYITLPYPSKGSLCNAVENYFSNESEVEGCCTRCHECVGNESKFSLNK